MIDPLNQQDRALVDLARGGCEPTEADRRRVRTALVARLGAGTGLVVTTALGTSVASSAAVVPVVTTVATKVMVAVVVAAAVGGGGIAYRAERGERAARVKATSVQPVRAPAIGAGGIRADRRAPHGIASEMAAANQPPPPGAIPVAPEAVVLVPTTVRQAVGAIRPARVEWTAPRDEGPPQPLAAVTGAAEASAPIEPPVFVAPSPPPSPPPSPAPARAFPLATVTPTTIEAETRLVRAGIAALQAGDTVGALALLDRHARVYASGVLAEERDTERIAALCALGREVEARAAVAAFLRSHPRSHLVARVRSTCGIPSIP